MTYFLRSPIHNSSQKNESIFVGYSRDGGFGGEGAMGIQGMGFGGGPPERGSVNASLKYRFVCLFTRFSPLPCRVLFQCLTASQLTIASATCGPVSVGLS